MRGLYVHIPFCVRKCTYCDFYSLPGRINSIERYVETVLREANTVSPHSYLSPCGRDEFVFQTLYIGGGTPSLLGAANLKKLVAGLRRTFDLSGLFEATIEVNPESASGELLTAAVDSGINRISIGIQSLSDYELRSVGRVHNATQAVEAITRAKETGFKDISCDVIVGLPGQSQQTLTATLAALAGFNVQHISMYCLSLEEGTPLALNPPSDLPTEDEQAEIFEAASRFLTGNGYIHYEISNFALPDRECRHNLNYWRGGEYLGLGPAAASHLGGKRFKNRADLDTYLDNPAGLIEDIEELDASKKAAEEAMLRLRLLSEGLDASELAQRFGNVEQLVSRLDTMVDEGWLVNEGSVYRLPPSRVLTSNPIFAKVLGD